MKTVLLIGIVFSALIPTNIYSPQNLGDWLQNNFTYQAEEKNQDYWQTAKETLKKKTGDCEDFAILTYEILTKLNYEAKIILIFKNFEYGHAVTVFKNRNRKWQAFSNTDFLYFEFNTINDLLNFYFSDFKNPHETDTKKSYLRPLGIDE